MKDKILKFTFFILMIGMLIANLINMSLIIMIISIILIGLVLLGYFLNKKHHFISEKTLKIGLIILLLLFTILRIYLIFNYNYELESDYKLYFDTAKGIFGNKEMLDTYYLSFNCYVVIFSSILGLFLKVFSSSITVAQLFNLGCQILTMLFFYKIINLKNHTIIKYWLPLLWFIMPSTIFSCLLISTESFFMLLFAICIHLFSKYEDINKLNSTNILKFIFLGIVLSLGNNIRSVMLAFIVAIIIYYLFQRKKLANYILLGITIITFILGNSLCNFYAKRILGENLREGSNAWALYFGANYQSFGMITQEDSELAFNYLKEGGKNALLNATIARYKEMGPLKTGNLYAHKFVMLWSDNTIMHDHANLMTNYKFSNVQLK